MTARGSMYWINLGATSPSEFGTKSWSFQHQHATKSSTGVVVVALHDGDEIWTLCVRTDDVHGQAAFAVQHNNPLSELKVRR